MDVKKMEWAKPVLKDMGAVLTEGQVGILGSCSTGKYYSEGGFENCIDGQGAITVCSAGTSPTGACSGGTGKG
jgi:hypothetical protein